MAVNESASLNDVGSSVKSVKKYNQLNQTDINGETLFERAEQGDELAIQITTKFYAGIARGIYNLLVCIDPGRIVIGGGVSGNKYLIPNVDRQLKQILLENVVTELEYKLVACEFGNDANLIGAVYHFIETYEKWNNCSVVVKSIGWTIVWESLPSQWTVFFSFWLYTYFDQEWKIWLKLKFFLIKVFLLFTNGMKK